jgi:thiol reductant ABC exporter CydC subunit
VAEGAGLVRESLTRERLAVRAALAAGLLVAMCTIGLAATSAWLIVRAAQRPSVLSLTVPMGLVQLFALAKAAGRYLERTQTHRAALKAMGHVRSRVAHDLEPLVPAGLGPRSADVVDAVLGDVERIQDLLTAVAGPLITSVVAGVVSAVICSLVSPLSGVVLVGALVVDAVVLPGVAMRAGRASSEESDRVHADMTSLFDQAAQSGDEFIMVGAHRGLGRRLDLLEDRLDASRFRRRAVLGATTSVAVAVNALACIAAAAIAVTDVRAGRLDAALVAVPALTTVAALELVSGVVNGVVDASRDRAAIMRLNALRTRPRPVIEPDAPQPLHASDGRVEMRDVSRDFDRTVVLRHANVAVSPGDVVVLEGPSGGGKTTVVRLLAKFLDPSRGQLLLGDQDYGELLADDVRRRVGIVEDAPHVFGATLGDNLRVARPDATDDELTRACDEAGLGEFLRHLPLGLATRLGGATTGLSGGEQRRLGVARELLTDRCVALFDEPTEGLDSDTATALLDSLREHYRGGSLVVVSHHDGQRLPDVRRWSLEGGRLREDASPAW